MDFADLLKAARRERRINQATAAHEWGVPFQTLKSWEQRRRSPGGAQLVRMLPHLGVTFAAAPGGGAFVFADVLKVFRRNKGQHEAADALGVSFGALQDWEQGRRLPTGATLLRVLPILLQSVKALNDWKASPETRENAVKCAQLEATLRASFQRRRRPKIRRRWRDESGRLQDGPRPPKRPASFLASLTAGMLAKEQAARREARAQRVRRELPSITLKTAAVE